MTNKIEIIKRTFVASKHPKGSKERDVLNEKSETSEYMTSYKYIVREHKAETETHLAHIIDKSYKSKEEAQQYLNNLQS